MASSLNLKSRFADIKRNRMFRSKVATRIHLKPKSIIPWIERGIDRRDFMQLAL